MSQTAGLMEEMARQSCAELDIPLKEGAMTIRLALTGRRVGPSLWEIMSVMGPDIVSSRLREAAETCQSTESTS
jgi:glutamyl/glutaminyl-tRNA synthetase